MEKEGIEGLETLESSQEVTNLSEFLELDSIEDNDSGQDIIIPEDNDLPIKKDETEETPLKGELPTVEAISEDLEIELEEDDGLPTTVTSGYKGLVTELMENGIIEPFDVLETPDGEVPLEDIDIDKDTLLQILKYNQELNNKKLKESTIPVDNVSDFTKKLISIEQNGGNVSTALKAYETIKEPLDGLDVNDVNGQKAICYLRLQQQGVKDDEAKDLIETYESKGKLEAKAHQFKAELEDAFNKWMEKQEEKAIKENEAYQNTLKTYRKNLNDTLKGKKEFTLSDTHRNKLLDIATKETKDGRFELDNMIDNFRRDPEKLAELVLFITDPDKYIETKSKKKLDEERKDTLRKMSLIPKVKSDGIDLGRKSSRVRNKDIFPID